MIIPFPSQGSSPRDKAQELAWQAMEYIHRDDERAAQLCHKALDVYPDCVDAIHLLADIESQWQRDFIIGVKKAIEAGRRELGEEFFRENKGSFWGLIETRPFMRAMGALAEALADNEYRLDEAIAVHEEMLELNPNDNQGIRYGLLGCYLAKKQYYKAQMLLDRYPDEISAFFLWGRVLLDYATQGEDKAAKTLREARKENSHVEQYFFPRKQKPHERLGNYSPGDESEAIVCAQLLHIAWKAHSSARKWLQQACAAEVDMDGHVDNDLREMMDEVPKAYAARFVDLVKLTDTFCDAHLNIEYKDLCREMAITVCQKDSPVLKGKPEGWAAGIVYALGRINFLDDPTQTPHMKSKQIAEGLGVSVATMQAKAKVIREGLELIPFHPDWSLPSRMDDNPLVWMLEVNGFLMDIRMAPREAQVAAYEKGLIPYIPADRDE